MNYIKNFVPSFAITALCMGSLFGFVFLLLALMPAAANTMSATQVAQGLGGWHALVDWGPILLFITTLVAAWVAAMEPFTSKRTGLGANRDTVFAEPYL